MKRAAPIMQREMSVYLYSPFSYVLLFIFLLVSSIFFMKANFLPGEDASLRPLLERYMPLILVFFLPMLTMRLVSEEYRGGTIESLMTAPVSDTDVVAGKFLGAFFFYLIMLACTLVYAGIIASFGNLDGGMLFSTYLGLVLLGALYVAVGVFFSACTKHQLVADACTFVTLALFTYMANWLANDLTGVVRLTVLHLSILDHYRDFARGLIDLNHVLFFVSTTFLFLFLAVKVLESRRWR